MDTKVIAMVGAVIVVGAAVYGVATGTVLPDVEEITEEQPTADEEPETEGGDGNDESESGDAGGNTGDEADGDAGGDDAKEGADEEDSAVANETENPNYPEPEPLPVVCQEQGGNIGRGDVSAVPSAAGPVFDPIRFESMLHNSLNGLRAVRSDAGPLRCDPELREIAREHSELHLLKKGKGDQLARGSRNEIRERVRSLGGSLKSSRGVIRGSNIRIKPAKVRYEGVCENPRETVGRWFYQRYTSGTSDSSGGTSDQRIEFIADHEDLLRDVRGSWGDREKFISKMTNRKATRQGVGAYIDRQTREVVVTHVVCGPRPEQTQNQDS